MYTICCTDYLNLQLVCAQLLSCVRLFCDSMDCSPPGSSVRGIFQARILEWVAISSSGGIFPIQGLNQCLLCLLHQQADSLPPCLAIWEAQLSAYKLVNFNKCTVCATTQNHRKGTCRTPGASPLCPFPVNTSLQQ